MARHSSFHKISKEELDILVEKMKAVDTEEVFNQFVIRDFSTLTYQFEVIINKPEMEWCVDEPMLGTIEITGGERGYAIVEYNEKNTGIYRVAKFRIKPGKFDLFKKWLDSSPAVLGKMIENLKIDYVQ